MDGWMDENCKVLIKGLAVVVLAVCHQEHVLIIFLVTCMYARFCESLKKKNQKDLVPIPRGQRCEKR